VNIGGKEPETRRSLATNAIVLALGTGGLVGLIVGVLSIVFPAITGDLDTWLLVLALTALPLLVLGSYLSYLVQADYGFRTTNAAWLIGPVVNVGVNSIFAVLGILTVHTAVLTWFGGQILKMLVLAQHVMLRGVGFGRFDPRLAWRSLVFGLKSHVGQVAMLGNYRLDQWILGAIAGTTELGLYSVAVSWAETLFFLPTSIGTVQRPHLVRATREDAAAVAARVCRVGLLLTVPLAFGLFIAAPELCTTVFGNDFSGSVTPLRILVFGGFGIVVMKQLSNALVAQRLPLRASAGLGIALFATILLDATLIPFYGAIGASIASTVAYTVGAVAVGTLFLRELGGRPSDLVPRPGDATFVWAATRRQLGRREPAELTVE